MRAGRHLSRSKRAYLVLKRLIDIGGSLFGIIVLSPLLLICAIGTKCSSKGPILFRQARVGLYKKEFMFYKFRSMTVASEKDGKPALCQKNDKRLTKIGKFLREHHLDELPQLWNVLKGDMSFVGPRPERKFYVDQIKAINPDYELLYQLRPGLFSAATLYNGYTDTMEKMLIRLQMDLKYLRERSLWLDCKIIFLTVASILTGKKF